MKPGSVVLADIPGVVHTKKRPAVVVSSTLYHADRPDVILAVVSSQIHKATSKTDFVLKDWQTAGLLRPSFVRMFLYSAVASEVIRIGHLSSNDWQEVMARLRMSVEV